MRLYLVQHGIAKPKEVDPERPLADEGIRETEIVADYLSRIGIRPRAIYQSGKLRAKQTAEIIAGKLGVDRIEEDRNLEPLADPRIWAERLREKDEDLMLVGHLPHLSRLASLLLVGEEDREIIRFRYSGVVCLERAEDGSWKLVWMITPDILPSKVDKT